MVDKIVIAYNYNVQIIQIISLKRATWCMKTFFKKSAEWISFMSISQIMLFEYQKS